MCIHTFFSFLFLFENLIILNITKNKNKIIYANLLLHTHIKCNTHAEQNHKHDERVYTTI